MKIIANTNESKIATVYIAETQKGKYLEFVESIQPPFKIEEKWVLIISTLYGCPVSCAMCDCGYYYNGKITKDDIFAQIDYLIKNKFPNGKINVKKFKIQFARMGEPAFNNAVLDVLEELPSRYDISGLYPSISTIGPNGKNEFFNRLINIKNKFYPNSFQLQFSIHTTDIALRDKIIPLQKWSFSQIADYGNQFYRNGGKKISLNFALAKGFTMNPEILTKYFDPIHYLIKLTPVNPTYRSTENRLISIIKPSINDYPLINELKKYGYEVILNIGQWEENKIGSNCGQYILKHIESPKKNKQSYTYGLDLR